MSVKHVVRSQYQATVNIASGNHQDVPSEGWIRTVRKALGMSGAQLGRRMGVTRARIAQAEKSELEGGATLRSMREAAEAMGCRFVYAFVPPIAIENVILAQAKRKARSVVGKAGQHMALEGQAVSDSVKEQEVARLASELVNEMPRDFWQDK